MSGGSHSCMIETDALVSDCDCVRKSRFRSKLFPFARWFAMRPSGFWSTFHKRTTWSRIASTSGSVPYGVVATRSTRSNIASTPSDSFPWIADWMKIGTFTLSPAFSSIPCARTGSVSAIFRMFCQVWKSLRCWFVSSALIVTRYRSRPSAD